MQQLRLGQPGRERPTEVLVMIRMASNRSAPSAGLVKPVDRPPIFPAIAEAWRELRKGFIDSYRPELHYMRGPGPKWREKHGAAQATRSGAVVGMPQGAAA